MAELKLPQKRLITRWLVTKQCNDEGGFKGRTEKDADVCYSFWCGAALDVRSEDREVTELPLTDM